MTKYRLCIEWNVKQSLTQICNQKYWDSAYVRQGMSYQCRDIRPTIRRIGLGLPPKFNHLFIGPSSTFPENFMPIPAEVFAQIC